MVNFGSKLAPRPVFLRRLFRHFVLAIYLVILGLGVGVLGYHWFLGYGWGHSVQNSVTIFAGLGPVDMVFTRMGQVWLLSYAMFRAFIFIIALGIFVAPIVHRILHRFVLEDLEQEERDLSPEVRSPKRQSSSSSMDIEGAHLLPTALEQSGK